MHPGLSPEGPVRPDFLILGAQKSATTALAAALRTHPDVFLPRAKEAHHFGSVADDEAGGPSYRAFFEGWQGQRLIGDASPDYLVKPSAAAQIVRVAPRVQAITVLRNPIDRAYSAYWHGVAAGQHGGSFERALELEQRRPDRAGAFRQPRMVGCYMRHIERFLDAGLPRHQWLFLLHDDVVADPVGSLRSVQDFLGLEPVVAELPQANTAARTVLPKPFRGLVFRNRHRRAWRSLYARTRRPLNPPPMEERTREELRAYYAPLNEELGRFLGRDLSHWV